MKFPQYVQLASPAKVQTWRRVRASWLVSHACDLENPSHMLPEPSEQLLNHQGDIHTRLRDGAATVLVAQARMDGAH